jgi:hypothetical protein
MGMRMVGVQVQIAVVLLPFCGRAERGVGFGDLDEALGGVGVRRVAVWMVGFGEGVEGPGEGSLMSFSF